MSNVYEDIHEEVWNAVRKFPKWPVDPIHAVAVIGEEFGELTQAVLQHTYEPEKSDLEDVRIEAVQTAAMCIRFLSALHEYEFEESAQVTAIMQGDVEA